MRASSSPASQPEQGMKTLAWLKEKMSRKPGEGGDRPEQVHDKARRDMEGRRAVPWVVGKRRCALLQRNAHHTQKDSSDTERSRMQLMCRNNCNNSF